MRGVYKYMLLLAIFTACKSRREKAVDELLSKAGPMGPDVDAHRLDYILYVPDGWTTRRQLAYDVNYYFLNPPKTNDAPADINLVTVNMQNVPLQEFREKMIESLKAATPDASDFEEGNVIANGREGVWYSYTMSPQGMNASFVCYIFPKDGVAYMITAGTFPEYASRYRSLFDSVARSLKFVEPESVEKGN